MSAPATTTQKHVKAKVCLVGDVAVGKTSLIKRFVLESFDDRYVATVGTKVTKKTLTSTWKGQPATVDLMVWDIMGEKGFRVLLRDAYFEGTHGVLAVCDLTRKDTFYDLDNWVQMVRKQVGDVSVVFLGNKADLTERIAVNEEELARMGAIHNAKHFLASAKTGQGVNEAFQALADAIGHRGEA
ncbi:MAG: Rab family GTPase [Candidatus Thermoplasmatota archaeon]